MCCTDYEAKSGTAPIIMDNIVPCGDRLTGELLEALCSLYSTYVQELITPRSSDDAPKPPAGPLVQSLLHGFGVRYSAEEYAVITRLGIYPALHTLFTRSVGDDRAESQSFQTSAWALLDFLMSTVLSLQKETENSQNEPIKQSDDVNALGPVFDILSSQLQSIAAMFDQLTSGDDAKRTGKAAGSGKKKNDISLATARKVNTAVTFGIQQAAASAALTADREANDGGKEHTDATQLSAQMFGDAFGVKVLSLVHTVTFLENGGIIASEQNLRALFQIVAHGSPRARLVACRILQRVLTTLSPTARPSLQSVDAAVSGADSDLDSLLADVADAEPGKGTISFLFGLIGKSLSASAFALLSPNRTIMEAHGKTLAQVIADMFLPTFYSPDGVCAWADCTSLVRQLCNDSEWRPLIASVVHNQLASLPALLNSFIEIPEIQSATNPVSALKQIVQSIWSSLGAMYVVGAHIGGIHVGCRVMHALDKYVGVVVARHPLSQQVSIIRGGTDEVTNVPLDMVVGLFDVPVNLTHFVESNDLDQVLGSVISFLDHLSQMHYQHLDVGLGAHTSKINSSGGKIRVKELLFNQLRLSSLKMLHAFSQLPELGMALARVGGIQILHRIGCGQTAGSGESGHHVGGLSSTGSTLVSSPCFSTVGISTSELDDRSHQLCLELTRRAQGTSDVEASVQVLEQESKLVEKKPGEPDMSVIISGGALEIKGEMCFGLSSTDVGDMKEGETGLVSYVPLDHECNEHNSKNRIVLLDNYKNFQTRISSAVALGARAVLVSLMDQDFKLLESMGLKRKKPNASSALLQGQNEEEVVARMAMDAAFAESSGIVSDKDKATEKEQDEPSEEIVKVDAPVVAITAHFADLLRGMLGVPEEQFPLVVSRQQQLRELETEGFATHLCEKALNKTNGDVKTARKWLEENAEWLVDNDNMMSELENEVLNEKNSIIGSGLAPASATPEAFAVPGFGSFSSFSSISQPNMQMAASFQQATLSNSQFGTTPFTSSPFFAGNLPEDCEEDEDEEFDYEENSGSGNLSFSFSVSRNAMPAQPRIGLRPTQALRLHNPTQPQTFDTSQSKEEKSDGISHPTQDTEFPLAKKWEKLSGEYVSDAGSRFDLRNLGKSQNISGGSSSLQSQAGAYCDNDWFITIRNKSTAILLSGMMDTMDVLVSQYARRALVQVFTNWPQDQDLSALGSACPLKELLHLGLALEPYPATTVIVESSVHADSFFGSQGVHSSDQNSSITALVSTKFEDRLLSAIQRDHNLSQQEQSSKGSSLIKLILDDCVDLLQADVNISRASSAKTKSTRSVTLVEKPFTDSNAPSLGGNTGCNPALRFDPNKPHKLHVRRARGLRIQFLPPKSRQPFPQYGSLAFYRNRDCTDFIRNVTPNDAGQDLLVQSNIVWYKNTSNLQNIMTYNQQAYLYEFHIIASMESTKSDEIVLQGDSETAQGLLQMLLKLDTPIVPETMLVCLIEALPYSSSASAAHRACQLLALLFTRWSHGNLLGGSSVVGRIVELVTKMENAHAWLRTVNMVDWVNHNSVSPHMQGLMETLLVARKV